MTVRSRARRYLTVRVIAISSSILRSDRRSPERSAPRLYALIPSTALILIFVFHLRSRSTPRKRRRCHDSPTLSDPFDGRLLSSGPQPFRLATGTACPPVARTTHVFPRVASLQVVSTFILAVTAVALFLSLVENVIKSPSAFYRANRYQGKRVPGGVFARLPPSEFIPEIRPQHAEGDKDIPVFAWISNGSSLPGWKLFLGGGGSTPR
ncbi:hypothetical protein PUN28_011675 [Cardiocondyla obscurior]|uniref:Uncharacterized protein n=1 Tax=Cardiocondyla obscurior TaxID=286306 RepID=A0AAW2FFB0_9HYME